MLLFLCNHFQRLLIFGGKCSNMQIYPHCCYSQIRLSIFNTKYHSRSNSSSLTLFLSPFMPLSVSVICVRKSYACFDYCCKQTIFISVSIQCDSVVSTTAYFNLYQRLKSRADLFMYRTLILFGTVKTITVANLKQVCRVC